MHQPEPSLSLRALHFELEPAPTTSLAMHALDQVTNFGRCTGPEGAVHRPVGPRMVLVKSRGNRSRKSRPSPSSISAHRAPKISTTDPRSIEIRSLPDLPNRQPKNPQARAAKLRSAVALFPNSAIFSQSIESEWEMFRFGKLNLPLNGRFAITLFWVHPKCAVFHD